MASIIVVAGRSRGYYLQLEPKVTVVGREEGCDIQVLDDLVSRRHLEVRYDDDAQRYRLVDLQSANGVFISGRRVSDVQLSDGDVIEIGDSRILYTDRNFADRESAMNFFKHRGEGGRDMLIQGPPATEGRSDEA